MKLVLLAPGYSIHTARWVNALFDRGHVVHLITMQPPPASAIKSSNVHILPVGAPVGYFLNIPFLKHLLNQIRPDIVNAHRASGYGTLGRLSGFHPLVLSIWGNDVYDFPNRSGMARYFTISALRFADTVCSTSHTMARRAYDLYPKLPDLAVVPWGIDPITFSQHRTSPHDMITIGTVKTMAPKYGIDLLIRAFADVRQRLARRRSEYAEKIRLLIVGGGPSLTKSEKLISHLGFLHPVVSYATDEVQNLKNLADQLGITPVTDFAGPIPHEAVPDFLNKMDIYVAPSRYESESFGVAVLEASACELPVVVANIGGLPEVVVSGETGLLFPNENVEALSQALEQLLTQPDLRNQLGQAGRRRVLENYCWNANVLQMEQVFQHVLEQASG